MKDFYTILRFALFSFVTIFGYHMLGFELVVVLMLSLVLFNILDNVRESK